MSLHSSNPDGGAGLSGPDAADGTPAFLVNAPAFPEWPLTPQKLLPNSRSYLGRIYSTALGFRALTLDLHVPDGYGPFPVVLYASGGGFMLGSTVIGEWRPLVDRGYAVATINYRLRGEAKHPVPVDDIVAAALWLRSHSSEFKLDASRLLGVASSAGAYLLSFAALTRDIDGLPWSEGATPLFSGVVTYYAPTDFAALVEDSREDVVEQPGTAASSESQYLGYMPSEHPSLAVKASLAANVHKDAPPFFVLHGDVDRRVGVRQAHRFAEALEGVGARHQLLIVHGADHGSPMFLSDMVQDAVADFLERALIGAGPLPPNVDRHDGSKPRQA